jgi:hypothetical protein
MRKSTYPNSRRFGPLLLLAGAMLLSGAVSAGASASPAPHGQSSSKTVVVTNSGDGSNVLVNKGDLLVVKLSGQHLRWSVATGNPSTSAATAMLRPVSATTSSNGSSKTVFEVQNFGEEQIQAVGTSRCATTKPCPAFALLWHANVVSPVIDPPGWGLTK